MKTKTLKPNLNATIGLLLTVPALYFIFISVLKFVFGVPMLFDAAQPILDAWGVKGPIGWNVSLMFILGPLVAFLFNLTSVLRIDWENNKHQINFQLSFEMGFKNWLLVVISCLCMINVFVYVICENCNS